MVALFSGLLVVGAGRSAAAVPNGNFEAFEGVTAKAWRAVESTSAPGANVRVDQSVKYDGAASLAISAAKPASGVAVSEPIELRVGRLYRLSGWIKTDGVKSDPTAKYPTSVPACLTMKSFPFTNHSPAVGADSDWSRVETLFIATRGSDRVRLHLGHNGKATGTAWFDDVAVESVDDIHEYIPKETVRWHGNAYRYDDRGWIFVHIEGGPYERGYQYGSLLADDIVQYMTRLAIKRDADEPEKAWEATRFECNALFLRGYDEEYLTEMKGIADGAAAAGAAFHDRPVDLIDIVTVNSVIDLGQLHRAMGVTPHALTGESFLQASEEMRVTEEDHKCSAFVATGPATADGQIVFGQIFMWSGFTGVHWNVICDVDPAQGHRLVYHTFPGGFHSGADFYINEAGIVIGETTVSQTPYEPKSTPQSNRIRKAAQYASSIDDVERILWKHNNGMYTNDWPIADVKTNEAAILLLGTHRKKLWRTSEDLSPFGTPGFLWANNNNRDPEVRKEYLAQPDDSPFDLVFSPWNRDVAFNDFYKAHKGRIDSTAAVNLWATSPINRAHACDGKITTSEMARELVFLAHYGKVTLREKFPQKGYRIMPDLPGAIPHLSLGYATPSPIYVTEQLHAARDVEDKEAHERPERPDPDVSDIEDSLDIDKRYLWRRTVLPASAEVNWFVSASAAYWRMLEGLHDKSAGDAAEQLAGELAELNRRYLYTVSREKDLPAVAAERVYDRYAPYRIPRIKGTFALHQARLMLGKDTFLEMMRAIHDRYGEMPITNAQLLSMIDEFGGPEATGLVRHWITTEGLPKLEPTVTISPSENAWRVSLSVRAPQSWPSLRTHLSVETESARHLRRLTIDTPSFQTTMTFDERPLRVEFNALNDIPVDNDNFYVWSNLIDDFHDTLIVYGTARQDEANHTLARRWQETVANAYIEILPPLVKDSEMTYERAANHDLIVMGTLKDNYFFQDGLGKLPVTFGRNHFTWRGRTYADPDDSLFLVVPNPYNPDRVMYVLAANSALQLHQMTKRYVRDIASWAIFRGDEVTDRGYHPPTNFVVKHPRQR